MQNILQIGMDPDILRREGMHKPKNDTTCLKGAETKTRIIDKK